MESVIPSIIIDGYNLIGIHHKDLEAQRVKLIDRLIDYTKRKGHDITVVFDGWKDGGGSEGHSVRAGVRIIYSKLGEKADSVIKRIVSSDKREWIVVSSDRDIADHAWSTGSVPIQSETFIGILERPARQYQESDEVDDDEDYDNDFSRRGNPSRLSKKQKAIQRAVSKL